MPKIIKKEEKPSLQLGWVNDRSMENQLAGLVKNGIINITDRTSIEEFYSNIEKQDSENILRKIIDQIKKHLKWETDLVLNGKLDPKMAHKHVYDHPVVTQRDQILCEFLRKNQNKVKRQNLKKPAIIKKIEDVYCQGIVSSEKKLGFEMKPLKFGESLIVDYHKHGRFLKKKLMEHDKEIGIHLPKSKRQIKFNDKDLEMMKKIDIKDIQDLKEFDRMADKLISSPLRIHAKMI